MEELLEQTIRGLALRAHQKNIELVSDIQAGVATRVVGDPNRLRQILVNLVGNAIKFTGQGEVLLGVSASSENAGQQELHFLVADTGIGIPADKLHSIFDAFTQADGSMTRKYGGTGLGLAITSRLTGLMNGKMWVESEEGLGSQFHFTARFGCVLTDAPAMESSVVALRGARMLAVDDNDTSRRVIGCMLVAEGMDVELAPSGEEALAMLREAAQAHRPFRLAVLDAKMPGLDGFAVAETIQADPALRLPLLMLLSSADLHSEIPRCRQFGTECHITKPVSRLALREAILRVLGGAPTPAATPLSEPLKSITKLAILLAEDNPVNQKVAIRLLEKRGHRVSTEAMDAKRWRRWNMDG